jgi:hypothetical protein
MLFAVYVYKSAFKIGNLHLLHKDTCISNFFKDMYVIYVLCLAVFKTELAIVNKRKKLMISDKLNACVT